MQPKNMFEDDSDLEHEPEVQIQKQDDRGSLEKTIMEHRTKYASQMTHPAALKSSNTFLSAPASKA